MRSYRRLIKQNNLLLLLEGCDPFSFVVEVHEGFRLGGGVPPAAEDSDDEVWSPTIVAC